MSAISPPLESVVRRIGEQLARLSAGRTPTLFERRWWSQTALNLAMQDSRFKTQLFRFIDVLPSVTDDEQVVALARAYLGDGGTALFGGQWGLKALSARPVGAQSPFRHQLGGSAQRQGDQKPGRAHGAHLYCRSDRRGSGASVD